MVIREIPRLNQAFGQKKKKKVGLLYLHNFVVSRASKGPFTSAMDSIATGRLHLARLGQAHMRGSRPATALAPRKARNSRFSKLCKPAWHGVEPRVPSGTFFSSFQQSHK